MRTLFITALAFSMATPAYAQVALEPKIDAAYYRMLSIKVMEADESLFVERILPGKGSICEGSPYGFSVLFYSGGLEYTISHDCKIPSTFASGNGIDYMDFEMDGWLNVALRSGDRIITLFDVELEGPIDFMQQYAYQTKFEEIFRKLERLLRDI